jgi:hypothetical protein
MLLAVIIYGILAGLVFFGISKLCDKCIKYPSVEELDRYEERIRHKKQLK